MSEFGLDNCSGLARHVIFCDSFPKRDMAFIFLGFSIFKSICFSKFI